MSSPTERAVGPDLGHPARGSAIADRNGLTTTGAVLLVLLVGGAGAAYDVVTGNGLRLVFAGSFVVASALAGLLVRRDRLTSAAVMPPLTYLLLALGAGVAESAGTSSSFLTDRALDVVNALVLGAPVLVSAVLAVLLVVVVRKIGSRR